MPDDVFRWVIAAAVVLACLAFVAQAFAMLGIYRIARRTQDKVVPLADRAEPILDTTRKILEESRPRISEISAEAVEIAKSARAQADRIGDLLADGAERAKARLAQIDKTEDETGEHVEQAGDVVKTAVMKPVREVNGIMAGMKAAITTLAGGRRASVDHATQDEEMFI